MKSTKLVQTSIIAPHAAAPFDRLSALLDRFRVRAHLFHSGPLCGISTFEARPGRAFIHVLRRGALQVSHKRGQGLRARIHVTEPSVLLYPRATFHQFHNPPRDGCDFTCASLDFDGGERNPLVAALPPLLLVPLHKVAGLEPALDLLFAETDAVRCGSRLLADRLFEVVLIQLLRWLLDHPGEAGISTGLVAGLTEPRLARALVAVHRAPQDSWTLERLAHEAGMSRAAFASAFRLAVGLTPGDYLTNWRLTLAATALRNGRPLKLIAEEVGYGSAAALSKAFKHRLGARPRAWKDASKD